METVLWFKLLLIIILIIGNGYFVGAEVAITGARRSKIRQLADKGNKSALRVQEFHQEPERFYSVTQIGITIVSLALGAIGMDTLALIMGPWFENMFLMFGAGEELIKTAHMSAYIFAFIIISFLHVVGGELAPKILAFHKAEAVAMAVSWSVEMQYRAWTPVIWAMKHASNFLLWTWGQGELIGSHGEHFTMTQEEIRTIITAASEGDGILAPEDTKMIHGIMDMSDRTVRSAMVPRTDILAFPKESNLQDVLSKFREAPHERYLVFETNLDHIIGYITMKELLSTLIENKDTSISERSIDQFINPCYFVPNSKRLRDLLKEFKANRQQLAVVIDEYGGTEGIITLEDILEEIVGDYEDEFTQAARRVKKLENGQFIIDASMRITELGPVLHYNFPEIDDYMTIGGLIYHQLGRVPIVGDEADLDKAHLEVLEMDNHRITKLMFQHIHNNVSLTKSDETSSSEAGS